MSHLSSILNRGILIKYGVGGGIGRHARLWLWWEKSRVSSSLILHPFIWSLGQKVTIQGFQSCDAGFDSRRDCYLHQVFMGKHRISADSEMFGSIPKMRGFTAYAVCDDE